MSIKAAFKVGDQVIYPSHGLGEITEIETQIIVDTKLEVYIISFPQDKMTLKVPVARAAASGLRSLATEEDLDKVYKILESKPQCGNKMWSRRAQDYETKINSGDITAIASVIRDLYKNVDTDRSYSERNIYEIALNRLVSEITALDKISEEQAKKKLIQKLKEKLNVAA